MATRASLSYSLPTPALQSPDAPPPPFVHQSLDEVLTREIVFQRKKHAHQQPSALGAAFNRGRRPVRAAVRPGLTDMVD